MLRTGCYIICFYNLARNHNQCAYKIRFRFDEIQPSQKKKKEGKWYSSKPFTLIKSGREITFKTHQHDCCARGIILKIYSLINI